MNAVIIDDITLARVGLRADIEASLPDIKIIGEADGVVSGIKLIKEKSPDIIFLDIEMGDGIGFDILDILPDQNAKVIFVTASNNFAIKAFRYAAIDYLLKPVDVDELVEAVNKLKNKQTIARDQLSVFKKAMDKDEKHEKLILHTHEEIRVVNISDIIRCEAMSNYTKIYIKDQKSVLITNTLKEYDQILSSNGFIRTHQSHLVNGNFIHAYIKSEGGYILMKDDSHVPVSVRKKPEVIQQIAKL